MTATCYEFELQYENICAEVKTYDIHGQMLLLPTTIILFYNKSIERVSHFRCLRCDITYDVDCNVDHMLTKFQSIVLSHNSSTVIEGNTERDSTNVLYVNGCACVAV